MVARLTHTLCKLQIAIFSGLLGCAPVMADNQGPLTLRISSGAYSQERNRVQIPNDLNGTRFSLDDIAGAGPFPAIRLEAFWALNAKHEIRVMLAPLSYTETGDIDAPIAFAGTTFSSNQPVEASYRFNSWRLGYRYHWQDQQNWDLWFGGTLKVRDAEIELSQSDRVAADDDLGILPLLYLAGEYRFNQNWSAEFDLDALGGGPGRAIDLGVGFGYQFTKAWRGGLQYRALEGGADIDEVYNFAWFNSILLTLQYAP